METPVIYLIGSLRNPEIPKIGDRLREVGFSVFDDWFAAGPIADDSWRDYEQGRNHTYQEALEGHPAKHVFTFDEYHLNRAHGGVLVYPAGKSGHLELGYLVGKNKPGFILLDQVPERYDVMKQFAKGGVFSHIEDLQQALLNYPWPKLPKIEAPHQHEAMWLAGLLEGEGYFGITETTPRLLLQMTDKDIIEKAAKSFESSVWGKTRKTVTNKAVWTCGVAGLTAIEWMRILKPYLGIRRQNKIREVVALWLQRKTYNKADNSYWSAVFGL